MVESRRALISITLAHVAVYVLSTWWAGGLRGGGPALEVALIAANTVPLLLIRWNPVVVVLFFAAAYPTWLITGHAAHILQSLPTLTALYATGAWDRPLWLRSLALFSPMFMLGSAVSGWWEDEDPLEIGYIAIVFVVIWTLGVLIAARRSHVAELEEKTLRLERAERELAEKAVADERARIARELHDVVAHAMSVITVQAGVGGHLIETQPNQAADSLRTIEATGRQAMEEMRRMLAVLHGSNGEASETYPQPGLADVPRLVEQAEASGLRVTVREEGPAARLSPGLDLAAYRVIQEALTNVVKHASEANADVMIHHMPDRLDIEVRNRGAVPDRFEPGQGLRGMAERVGLYDGELEVGPDGSGFRVRAVFPTEVRP